MKGKKLLAATVSIALLSASFGEAGFTGSSNLPLLLQEFLTANAADGSVTFDEASGVLTLHGAVTKDMIAAYRLNEAVTSVVAEAGTILPSNCWRLFYGGITYISADNKWTSEYWTNLTSIDLSQCDTSNVTDMSDMFAHCCALTSLDLSNSDTSKVQNMSGMFSKCYALTSLDISSFDTSNVTDMSWMFDRCEALTSLNLSNFDTSNVMNMRCMFVYCSALTSLDVSSFDTSNVMDMYGMFSECYALTSLDLSNFDTSNVTDMSGMFSKCYALTSLDLSNSDTSKVQDMSRMFSECYALTSLDLSSFDTRNVTDMSWMFDRCEALTSLNLSSFDTRNVIDLRDMFSYCSRLTSLDLSSFDTSNVMDMREMFFSCSGLTSLDLSSFDTSNITDKDTYMGMRCMFCNCSALETIYTSYSWADPSVCPVTYSEGMFADAANLVGGNGTVYDKNVVGLSYAWIDSDEHPGYFTYKEVSVSTSLTTTAFTETRKVMLYGDTTQDDVFDISDVVLTCRFLAGDVTATIKDAGIASADVDGDGQVTSNDIALMLKKIGMRQTFDALQ